MNLKSSNLTMLVDFYELTMAHGYFENGMKDQIAYFDMFFRRVPERGGFAIMAGLEQLIDYLKNLHFTDEDIEFLRRKNMFSDAFLDYLKNFEFACDIYAIPEGTPIFQMSQSLQFEDRLFKLSSLKRWYYCQSTINL